jgi:hypothetical protein
MEKAFKFIRNEFELPLRLYSEVLIAKGNGKTMKMQAQVLTKYYIQIDKSIIKLECYIADNSLSQSETDKVHDAILTLFLLRQQKITMARTKLASFYTDCQFRRLNRWITG